MKYLVLLLLLLPFSAQAALTDSLVSYWKFNETSGDAADSHGANTLTNTNTATYSTGHINNACYLAEASNQYFAVGDTASLDITGDISMSCWVYLANITEQMLFMNKSNWDGGSNIAYVFYIDGASKLTVDLSSDGSQAVGSYHRETQSTASVSATTWTMVTATFDVDTNNVDLYVNGSVVTSTQTYGTGVSGIHNSNQDLSIGGAATAANDKLDGRMDECGIWSRTLTSGEVSELYNAGSGLSYPFGSAVASFQLWVLSLF